VVASGEQRWRQKQLTEREQRVWEHLRRAQEQGVGLAQYARQAAVDVGEIYSGKQSLVREGVIAARVRRAILKTTSV